MHHLDMWICNTLLMYTHLVTGMFSSVSTMPMISASITRACARTPTCPHISILAHIHACIHAHTHTYMHMHVCVCVYAHAPYAYENTPYIAYAYTRAPTTRTCDTHMQHTHIHKYKHTPCLARRRAQRARGPLPFLKEFVSLRSSFTDVEVWYKFKNKFCGISQ
jgi:hypothetical protein